VVSIVLCSFFQLNDISEGLQCVCAPPRRGEVTAHRPAAAVSQGDREANPRQTTGSPARQAHSEHTEITQAVEHCVLDRRTKKERVVWRARWRMTRKVAATTQMVHPATATHVFAQPAYANEAVAIAQPRRHVVRGRTRRLCSSAPTLALGTARPRRRCAARRRRRQRRAVLSG
jgi:hypothetical protein